MEREESRNTNEETKYKQSIFRKRSLNHLNDSRNLIFHSNIKRSTDKIIIKYNRTFLTEKEMIAEYNKNKNQILNKMIYGY